MTSEEFPDSASFVESSDPLTMVTVLEPANTSDSSPAPISASYETVRSWAIHLWSPCYQLWQCLLSWDLDCSPPVIRVTCWWSYSFLPLITIFNCGSLQAGRIEFHRWIRGSWPSQSPCQKMAAWRLRPSVRTRMFTTYMSASRSAVLTLASSFPFTLLGLGPASLSRLVGEGEEVLRVDTGEKGNGLLHVRGREGGKEGWPGFSL